jgi:Cu+-exporting ATPase
MLPPASIVEVELAVQGMTCGACAAKIQKELNEITGVEAAVNYATESAMVAFDGDSVSEATVIKALELAMVGDGFVGASRYVGRVAIP